MEQVSGIEQLLRVLPGTVCSRVLSDGDNPNDRLTDEEASSLSDRAVGSRRETFRLGRAAARDALDLLGAGRPSIPVGPGREPMWPEGVVGSITHAGFHAIAAVAWRSDVGGIGIDLEVNRPFEGLRERVAFGGDLAWLETLEGAEAERATMEVFSAKEAIFKAFYPRVGRFFGFEAATLEPAASGDHYLGRLIDGLVADYPSSRWFRVDVGWHDDLALASLTLDPP